MVVERSCLRDPPELLTLERSILLRIRAWRRTDCCAHGPPRVVFAFPRSETSRGAHQARAMLMSDYTCLLYVNGAVVSGSTDDLVQPGKRVRRPMCDWRLRGATSI